MKKPFLIFLLLTIGIVLPKNVAAEASIINKTTCELKRTEYGGTDGMQIERTEWECPVIIEITEETKINHFELSFSAGTIDYINFKETNEDKNVKNWQYTLKNRSILDLISYQIPLSGVINIGTLTIIERTENDTVFNPSISYFRYDTQSFGTCKFYDRSYDINHVADNWVEHITIHHYYDQNGDSTNQLTYQKQCEKPTCHVYEDGTYSGSDGNIVSELEYQKQCQTHRCETLSDGTKYGPNGSIVSNIEYQKQCEKPTCHVYEDGTYSGSDGNIVSKLEYQKQCQTHKCETLSDGTKYGPTGSIVSDIEYQKQCEKPTCHVYTDGTYSGPDGSIISELEYQKQCQVHKCETLSDGTKYGPTGSIISDIEYQKQCFVNVCKVIDNTYYGKNGTEVNKETYTQECTTEEKHYCEKINDTYYDLKGNVVNETEYQKQCQINICKIIDDTYFGEDGKEITEKEYEQECMREEKIICEWKNDKYYGPTGAIITKLEYQKRCQKNYCTILSDGSHYDQNGKEVSKEEYIKSCGTIENPKTGLKTISMIVILILLVIGNCFYWIGKKNKIYYLK